jgi:hypothetical protein
MSFGTASSDFRADIVRRFIQPRETSKQTKVT